MNRRSRIAYVVAAALAAVSIGMLVQGDAQAQRLSSAPVPPPPVVPGRWEYATLRFEILRDAWAWHAPDGIKRGEKHKLFKDLGGSGRDHQELSYVDVANQAGLSGWEVTAVIEREKGTEIWFKRLAR